MTVSEGLNKEMQSQQQMTVNGILANAAAAQAALMWHAGRCCRGQSHLAKTPVDSTVLPSHAARPGCTCCHACAAAQPSAAVMLT
jgi:hypothetical protein